MVLDGAVKLVGLRRHDGADRARDLRRERTRIVRAPGPVEFTHGRLHATGIGMTCDKTPDILTILDQARRAHRRPTQGDGRAVRHRLRHRRLRPPRQVLCASSARVRMLRAGQNIDARTTALMHLSADEKQIETVELRDHARITSAKVERRRAAGDERRPDESDVRAPTARRCSTRWSPATRRSRSPARPASRAARSSPTTIDIALAPDGSTPTALLGRENVQLTFPPEPGAAGRTIRAATLDAKGEPGKGLTRARVHRRRPVPRAAAPDVDRAANSGTLDVGLKPGMSAIDDAKFAQAVQFEEGKMAAQAAAAHYDIDKGTLALSGTEPGMLVPHVVNEQIAVDAATIDVTLAGPKLKAAGNVRSTLKPASAQAGRDGQRREDAVDAEAGSAGATSSATTLDYDGDQRRRAPTPATRG